MIKKQGGSMRTCSLCKHPKRHEIDEAMANHVPLRALTKQFGTSIGTLSRHKEHMIQGYARILPERKDVLAPPDPAKLEEAARSHLGEVVDLKHRAMAALDKAEEADNNPAAVVWFREVRSTLELLCKIKLAEAQQAREFPCETGNLEKSAEWRDLRARMLDALLPFGEARAALLGAMRAQGQTLLEEKVSPAVELLIQETLRVDPPEKREDRRPQAIMQKDASRAAQEKLTAPDNPPHGERRAVQRIWYRCTAPTSHGGMNWIPGQIIDGSRLEIYPPPLSGCWEPFVSTFECPRAPLGPLQGTRRRTP
jgi:hypothetical protein